MIETNFFKPNLTLSCCSRWFCNSIAKPTVALVIFLLACYATLPCSQTQAQKIQVSAELELKSGTRDGLLTVTAEVPDGFHTYSLTQPAGGPTRSTLKLDGTGIQLTSDFVPQQEPEKHDDEFIGPVEELRTAVSWVAKVQVSPEVNLAKLDTKIDLYAQVCDDETQQCQAPTTYTGKIELIGETADLEFPKAAAKEHPNRSQPSAGAAAEAPGDTKYLKRREEDTPEQISAMAELYDVNEPIKYIEFDEMNQFPVAPLKNKPTDQTVPLLWLMLVFISGAMISVMVYMVFNRSVETEKTAKQGDDQPVYPRMRRIAFAACLIFAICIVANGLLLIATAIPWTSSQETHQAATTNTPKGFNHSGQIGTQGK